MLKQHHFSTIHNKQRIIEIRYCFSMFKFIVYCSLAPQAPDHLIHFDDPPSTATTAFICFFVCVFCCRYSTHSLDTTWSTISPRSPLQNQWGYSSSDAWPLCSTMPPIVKKRSSERPTENAIFGRGQPNSW